MKILMIARSTLFSAPGGDTTQIVNTAKYLQYLGCEVTITVEALIDYRQYDLIHFFNVIRPDDILIHIQRSNLPFVVSTIFVDYAEYEKKSRSGLFGVATRFFTPDSIEYLKVIARYFINGDRIKSRYYLIHGQRKSIRYILRRTKMALPNSNNEYKRLTAVYKVSPTYKKVVNAIDKTLFNDTIAPNHNFRNHVICVARIEGLKNQLNLIKALLGTDIQLTIIGKPSPNHIKYYKACKSLASNAPNIRFINHIKQEDLVSIYKAAKVHVLPSWFETTGLSSLEAGAMDCNIVITDKGDAREYFGDMAYYCEPDDVISIRNAVLKAFNNPINKKLKPYILENYTWEQAAQETYNAYLEVLNINK